MTKAELLRCGDDRKRIFQNFLNGVSKQALAETFRRSVAEVERDIAFVAKKIAEYRHQHCLKPTKAWGMMPPIPCSTEYDILANRAVLRWTLEHIGPETLASELLLPGLTTHTLGQNAKPSDVQHAARAVRAHTLPLAA